MAEETVTNIARGYVPYDDALICSHELFNVLSLLYAAKDLTEDDQGPADYEGLSSPGSRLNNLLGQALEKVASSIRTLNV